MSTPDPVLTREDYEQQIRDQCALFARVHAGNLAHVPEADAQHVYKGPYDLLLKHGRSYDPGAILPDEWNGIIEAQIRYCYDNAQRLALKFPRDLRYVEGIGYNLIPAPHAWCVTRDGAVVDVTWAEMDRHPKAYFGITIPLAHVRKARKTETISVLFGGYTDLFKTHYTEPDHAKTPEPNRPRSRR